MKTASAILFSALLLGSCTTADANRLAKGTVVEPASPDECAFVMDFIQQEHASGGPKVDNVHHPKVVLTRFATGMKRLPSPNWGTDGPDVDTRTDLAAKLGDVRLDTCPGLEAQLHAFGWSFWDGHSHPGWYWTLSRVGFNADHTQAVVFLTDGWGQGTGDAGLWGWSKRDPGTGHWKSAGGGGGWIS